MGLFSSKEEYVCKCMHITEEEIVKAIKNGADTFEKVKEVTGAATKRCKGRRCRGPIEDLIKENI